jgi:ABC-2 type transport system ATP-binding protein
MDEIIQVQGLCKTFRVLKRQPGWAGALRNLFHPGYRLVEAVKQVSFGLKPGELVGYLGPNGAGKSTTLKILTGLLVPTSGSVVVDGWIPWKNRTSYVAQIGAVFGQRSTLWWDLPVIDSLEVLQAMYRIAPQRFKYNLKQFSQLLDMDEFVNTPVRSLSLGQRMRADLCAALMHEPKLVFLDEPTIGLDVVAKERIREFIRYINKERGTTILLTTHDLSDVEKLCERVMILDHGQLLYDGNLEDLTNRFEGERTLMVTYADDYPDIIVNGARLVEREGRRVIYAFDWRNLSSSELIRRILADYKVADLEVKRPALDQTIRRIYEEELLLQEFRLSHIY